MKKLFCFFCCLLFAAAAVAQGSLQFGTGEVKASGNITTQNLVPAGTATAGSAVEITLANQSTLGIQVTGTYTGVLSVQTTIDGLNWLTVSDATALTNVPAGTQSATIASATVSQFTFPCEALGKVRVTGLAAMTGTATVTLKAVTAASMVTMANALPAGAATIGVVNPGNTANTTAWLVETRTGTTNGSTTSTLNSAATTNATSLKATAGMVFSISVFNASAATKYFRLYNKASAPTVGTDVPILIVAVPATSSKEIVFPGTGLKMATGIAYAVTGGATVADATAVAAADVLLMVNWN